MEELFDDNLQLYSQLEQIKNEIQCDIVVDEESARQCCSNIPYINTLSFLEICEMYGYPITVIRQLKYT